MEELSKEILWVGSSLKDLKEFPEEPKREAGFALFTAQQGGKHPSAKPLRGFHGASVLEIVEDFDTDTYRVIYTVEFEEAIYVLHCFKKKSRSGIATPKQDIEIMRRRFNQAEKEHKLWLQRKEK